MPYKPKHEEPPRQHMERAVYELQWLHCFNVFGYARPCPDGDACPVCATIRKYQDELEADTLAEAK